jgi:hypothetical protein
MTIPRSVVEADHRLEGASDRSTLELAKHRWHQCLDPAGPRHPVREYARAIGRSDGLVSRYAKGYALYMERASAPPRGVALTIQDAVRLADQSEEIQQFSEAIAEGAEVPVARVARGDNRRKTREIIDTAKERAERKGTDPLDEARDIARKQRKTRDMEARRRKSKAERHEARWLSIENCLSQAKIKLTKALKEAEGVDFDDEELDLLRATIQQVRAVLDLLDMRMAGTPDIDWDAELAKLGGSK